MNIQNQDTTSKPPRIMSASSLTERDLPPQKWAIRGFLPEGVTLLASKPKIGKSWMAMAMCADVASGKMALGRFPTPAASESLYLALEDNERRLQSRLNIVCQDGPPKSFSYSLEWPRSDEGGIGYLSAWLREHPSCRLVVIDTLAMFRTSKSSRDKYKADYDAIAQLRAVANEHGVAILVVHHTTKAKHDDIMDELNGTMGLAGAADTIAVLGRLPGIPGATIKMRGRDVEETEIGVILDHETMRWSVTGESDSDSDTNSDRNSDRLCHSWRPPMPPGRAKIFDALKRHGTMTPKEVAAKIGLKEPSARQAMRRMASDGFIENLGGGRYSV